MKAIAIWITLSVLSFGVVAQSTEDFDPTPQDEVREGVERQRGGSPALYRQTHEAFREYDRYQEYDPKVDQKSETVTLSRNNLSVPFEVEVSEGYITTLTFLDVNGNPYPTRISRPGDPTTFVVCVGVSQSCEVGEEDLDIAHILTIGTTRLAGRSNLRVFFRGLDRAVQIPLVGRTGSYHNDVTIMLPVENPDIDRSAQVRHMRLSLPETDDYYARALIDNIPGSKLPKARDLDVEVSTRDDHVLPSGSYAALYANGKTYLRTDITLPNPGAEAITPGAMRQVVYRFDGKPRVITGFNRHGQIVKIALREPENILGYREIDLDGQK